MRSFLFLGVSFSFKKVPTSSQTADSTFLEQTVLSPQIVCGGLEMLRLPIPKRVTRRPLVTVSASFRRFLREVQLVMEELFDEGAVVLSPTRPTPYAEIEGGFLLLEGDRSYFNPSVRNVEDRHLMCIARSDFLWVVCPDGYIGNSTAMEIGAAVAADIPIYSLRLPRPLYIAAYVTVVHQVRYAVSNHKLVNL